MPAVDIYAHLTYDGSKEEEMGRIRRDNTERYSLQQTWDIHHEIMRLSLVGMKHRDIAAYLGITAQMVSYTLNSPLVRDKMANMAAARDIEAVDVAKEIRDLAPKALRVLEDVLDSDSCREADKIRAATDILDRAGHAAIRTVRTENVHAHFTKEELEDIKQRARDMGLLADSQPVIDLLPMQAQPA